MSKYREFNFYFLIRKQWVPSEYTHNVQCDPEDMLHHACRLMAEQLVTAAWAGSELKVTWTETGNPRDEITLRHNDPLLDDYVVEERENQRQRAEESRMQFRSAI